MDVGISVNESTLYVCVCICVSHTHMYMHVDVKSAMSSSILSAFYFLNPGLLTKHLARLAGQFSSPCARPFNIHAGGGGGPISRLHT